MSSLTPTPMGLDDYLDDKNQHTLIRLTSKGWNCRLQISIYASKPDVSRRRNRTSSLRIHAPSPSKEMSMMPRWDGKAENSGPSLPFNRILSLFLLQYKWLGRWKRSPGCSKTSSWKVCSSTGDSHPEVWRGDTGLSMTIECRKRVRCNRGCSVPLGRSQT